MPPIGKPVAKPAPVAAPTKKPAPAPVKKPAPAPAPEPEPEPDAEEVETGVAVETEAMIEDLEGAWGEAETKEGFGELPDGKYQVRIEGWKIGPSKSSGRNQCSWTFKVANGDHVNRLHWKHDGLADSESIGWFKGGLVRLGVEMPASIKQLPATLDSLVGTFCEINIKHKAGSEYANTYFNKALDSDIDTTGLTDGEEAAVDTGEAEPAAEEAVAEEAPFADWKVGDKCQSQFGEDWYVGEIKKILPGHKASVLFEDNTTETINFGDLSPVDDGEVQAAETGEEEPAEEPSAAFTIGFDDAAINVAQQQSITKVAKSCGMNAETYDSWVSLLSDLCDYGQITGNFATITSLLPKIMAIKPKVAPGKKK